jgi:protein-disulfide isomerase
MPTSLLIRPDDHLRGNPGASLAVIMYADYQCRASRATHAALTDLQRRLGSRLCVVMRHFVLTDLHPYATLAAEAAEAAAAQGAFWPMHNALFALQQEFEPALLPALAERLGLDADLLMEDVARHAYQGKVEASTAAGTHVGVVATPTLFINGVKHEGDNDEAGVAEAMMRFVG